MKVALLTSNGFKRYEKTRKTYEQDTKQYEVTRDDTKMSEMGRDDTERYEINRDDENVSVGCTETDVDCSQPSVFSSLLLFDSLNA